MPFLVHSLLLSPSLSVCLASLFLSLSRCICHFRYTVGNDVSARRWQGKKMNNQWSRAKSFDTFCPLGPRLVLASAIPDPQKLRVKTVVNGDILQSSNTSDMIFSVAEIVSFLSQDTTLLPGTGKESLTSLMWC